MQPLTPAAGIRQADPRATWRRWTAQFSSMGTENILGWAWNRFGNRAAIGTSFQGSGLVMMHLAKIAGLGFPIFTLDTGLLFPEMTGIRISLAGVISWDA